MSKSITCSNEPVSQNIQRIAREKGITKAHIARSAGLTAKEFSDSMNGRRLFKLCEVPDIADALGCSISNLFGRPTPQEIVFDVTDNSGELLASIGAGKIIEREGIKVMCVTAARIQ